MRKKPRPTTEIEKRFIRRAARIAKNTTATEIARRLGLETQTIIAFIKREKLRTKEESLSIAKMALRKKHFPAHDMKPKIIEFLKETKGRRNMSLSDIARTCKVSLNYVSRVNSEEGILSKKELKELQIKIIKEKKAPSKFNSLYQQARLLLENREMSLSAIAKQLKVSPSFVGMANRGKGEDKQIRSQREIYESAYKQKRTNLFSKNQKNKLLEKLKPYIWTVLKSKKVPIDARNEIIDDVTDGLFKKLDYYTPVKGIPVEGFLMHFSKFYLGNAIGRSLKSKTGKLPTDSRDQAIIATTREKQPLEAAFTKEVVAKMNMILDKRESYILTEVSKGKGYAQIAEKLDLSKERVGKIRKKAIETLRRALEK